VATWGTPRRRQSPTRPERRRTSYDLGRERVSDATTLLKFRRLLEKHQLGEQLFATVGQVLRARGLKDAYEAAQCGAVEQRILAGFIGEIEPVLHEVHAQHALEPDGRSAIAGLGVVRLDHLAQLSPRNDLVHRRKKYVALGRSAIALETGILIGCRGKGLLLHDATTH